MRKNWFLMLMVFICLEGLGRKYLPSVPTIAFYFAKDLILVGGLLLFRTRPQVRNTGRLLYRGYAPYLGFAMLWTFLQIFNPEHESLALAVIGIRAYWLWWLAPFVVATVLGDVDHRRRAIRVMAILTIGISVLAVLQFVSPPDSVINLYSVVDGEALYAADSGTVTATGRARVSGTFAFISGFCDFEVLVPTLLLSLGLETTDRRLRLLALGATFAALTTIPMSGSRTPVVLGLVVLAITSWSAGLFFTAIGRRVMIGALAGLVLAVVAFPDAMLGVQSRFDPEETQGRVISSAMVIPPVALLALDYPMAGLGTGMQQNARAALKVYPKYNAEIEVERYLIELGPIGFLAVWIAKFGLMMACYRAHKILKRAGKRAAAGAALSYAAVTFFGNLTFDHIWQALYFVGLGFLLAETTAAVEFLKAKKEATAPALSGVLPVLPPVASVGP